MNTGNRPSLNKPAISRQARSNANDSELFAMRRRAWLEQGVVVVRLDELAADSWLFAALQGFAVKTFGERV